MSTQSICSSILISSDALDVYIPLSTQPTKKVDGWRNTKLVRPGLRISEMKGKSLQVDGQ